MNQLDLFEIEEKEESSLVEEVIFQDGDRVKVKKLTDDEAKELEPEDYYYIKDYENKKGVISTSSKNPKNGTISYKVDFDRDKFGFFYGKDLISLDI
ncbi:hypothetical protein [Robertmurraya sp. FSL R5-0851]|uniref:hypothetical protein n=1 Tax=Robertmurraya sp. FSL R5-0851 TaxID=2921584 RepID=UPI0030FA8045